MTSGTLNRTTDGVAKVRAKFVDANKRRFGLRDGGVGPVARCQTHQLKAEETAFSGCPATICATPDTDRRCLIASRIRFLGDKCHRSKLASPLARPKPLE